MRKLTITLALLLITVSVSFSAEDNFKTYRSGLDSPAFSAFSIVKSDTGTQAYVTRGIYIGVGGDMIVSMADGSGDVTFIGVVAGTIIPIRVEQVKATGTTADSLIGLH